MKLTIFDLDNTLLSGDSDHSWGQFLVEKKLVDPVFFAKKNDEFYEQYKNQTLDIHAYQRFVLTPLSDKTQSERDELHREFMATTVHQLFLPKAKALIDEHKSAGDQLLIMTATNRFVTEPIAEWLGIDQLIATDPEEIDGYFTGEISGVPCFQDGKITRLKQWLKESSVKPDLITFYSDSINDKPLLEYADKAIAVDPDALLASYAEQQGWPIITLR